MSSANIRDTLNFLENVGEAWPEPTMPKDELDRRFDQVKKDLVARQEKSGQRRSMQAEEAGESVNENASAEWDAELLAKGAKQYKDSETGIVGFPVAFADPSSNDPFLVLYAGIAAVKFLEEEDAEINTNGIWTLPGAIEATPGTLMFGDVLHLDPGTPVEKANLTAVENTMGERRKFDNSGDMRATLNLLDNIAENTALDQDSIEYMFGKDFCRKFDLEYVKQHAGWVYEMKDAASKQRLAVITIHSIDEQNISAAIYPGDITVMDFFAAELDHDNRVKWEFFSDRIEIYASASNFADFILEKAILVAGEDGKLVWTTQNDPTMEESIQPVDEVYVKQAAKKVDTTIQAGDKVAKYDRPTELFGTVIDTYDNQRFAADGKTIGWKIKRVPMWGSGELTGMFYAGGLVKWQGDETNEAFDSPWYGRGTGQNITGFKPGVSVKDPSYGNDSLGTIIKTFNDDNKTMVLVKPNREGNGYASGKNLGQDYDGNIEIPISDLQIVRETNDLAAIWDLAEQKVFGRVLPVGGDKF